MRQKLVNVYANILHLRFTDVFASLPTSAMEAISPASFWARLFRVVLLTGRLVLNLFLPHRPRENITGKIWLYVVSKNNYEALHFIKEQLPETVFIAGQNKQIGIYNAKVNRLSTRWKIFYLYRFPNLLLGLYRLKGKRALRFFDLIFTATGYYELSLQQLRKYKPRAIIFSNDHNTDSRALLLAARELQIPTIYIQHASVSTSFPPLLFDLNLLEGQDALVKYQQCGPIPGAVKLIGMPKADGYLKYKNTGTSITSIGVCANIIDDSQAIRKVLLAVSQKFPELNITFRPHPGDTRDFSFLRDINLNIIFSDSKTELAFDFLSKHDALIAADSSIHLEATMLNILSIYYRFSPVGIPYDYYAYLQHGLIPKADSVTELLQIIKQNKINRPVVFQKAQYYNAVIGTKQEGHSHQIAVKYIQEYLAAALRHES